MAEFYDWSVVAATNNFAPPNGAPENMDYRDVNDTIRELMAQQARWRESVRGVVTTGGAQPAYTFTSPQTLGAYAVGQIFTFIAHADSTGAVTLNVSAPGALGARNVIDSRGVQLGNGDIKQNGVYTVITTASTFRVIGHLSQASLRTLIQDTLNRAYTTTNVADAYSITTDNPITAYSTGQLFAFTANFTNTTTSPTLNVDTVGAGALQDTGGSALGIGTIINGQTYLAVRTASAFRVIAGLGFNGILAVANGGTGSGTPAGARTNLGAANIAGDTFTGNVGISTAGGATLTLNGTGTNIIEHGRVDGSASTPAIDFHSGATAVDYDTRFLASGGSGVAGGGVLDIINTTLTHNTNAIFDAGNAATQAQQETATSLVVPVTPGRQHFHPSAAKAWAKWNGNTSTINAGYNVTSITDNGTGDFTINWTTSFSSADYAVTGLNGGTAGSNRLYMSQNPATAPTAAAFRVIFYNDAGSTLDGLWASVVAFGDV